MENWIEKPLNYWGDFKKGGLFSKADIDLSGNVFCIHYGELFTKYNEVIYDVFSKTNKKNGIISKSGDILFPASDVTPFGLGKASTILKENVVLGGDMHIFSPNKDIDSVFLSYQINLFKNEIIRLVTGSAVKHSKSKDIGLMPTLVPLSIIEQKKIAQILIALDGTINQTEQLIAKYKNIKQGLMHDLLTYGIDENGTIRSPQTHTFVEKKGLIMPEEWEVDYIGNIFDVISGATPATEIDEFWNGEINWITPNDLNKVEHVYINQSSRKITEKGLKNCSAQLIPINSIIMSSRAPIGYLAIALVEYTTNQGCKSFVIKNSNRDISEFYVFNLEFNMSKIKDLGTGTTFLEVSKSDLNSILLQFPQDKEEQQRIANIILQQDKLIESEQTNLAKLKNLKQGLMADLLTGKVRVKTESV